ncbi:MAG: hypothetical protein ACFFC7_12545 [Candidatus Hermodarchaeota archaeon]
MVDEFTGADADEGFKTLGVILGMILTFLGLFSGVMMADVSLEVAGSDEGFEKPGIETPPFLGAEYSEFHLALANLCDLL